MYVLSATDQSSQRSWKYWFGFSKDVLSHGGNLSAESCSLLRPSTALCCAFFSHTICCDSHGALRGEKKSRNASTALNLAALPMPLSSSFQLQSCCVLWFVLFSLLAAEGSRWHPGHTVLLCMATSRQSRLGLAKHSWSSTVQLAPPRQLALAGQA